ncbi:hypothetical protein QFZ82_001253 [Streptomyces sp. V4I23]|nr:hypothetical protein [Streptomyces sp. V4I23]
MTGFQQGVDGGASPGYGWRTGAAMSEQLLAQQDTDPASVPDRQESAPRSAIDLTALRDLKESRTDVQSLELTAERLHHLQTSHVAMPSIVGMTPPFTARS